MTGPSGDENAGGSGRAKAKGKGHVGSHAKPEAEKKKKKEEKAHSHAKEEDIILLFDLIEKLDSKNVSYPFLWLLPS